MYKDQGKGNAGIAKGMDGKGFLGTPMSGKLQKEL